MFLAQHYILSVHSDQGPSRAWDGDKRRPSIPGMKQLLLFYCKSKIIGIFSMSLCKLTHCILPSEFKASAELFGWSVQELSRDSSTDQMTQR